MKKVIIFLVFSIAISSSLFAQKSEDKKTQKRVDAYIETIESKITLSNEEKEKIIALKKEHTKTFFEIKSEYQDIAEQKEKRKENNKKFNASLKEAFGKERSQEIKKAAKKEKGTKKKKKGKKKKNN